MSLLNELVVLAGFLTLGLIVGTLWARHIRHDDSAEKRRAEQVHLLSNDLKKSVKRDRQTAWIEPWEGRRE